MKRTDVRLIIGNTFLVVGFAVCAMQQGSRAAAEDTLPNVVVLLCDDLGYGDLGSFGHPHIKTPNLDELAAGGIRLTDCYAASAVCSSSRAGLLTGRNPNRDGIYDWLPGGIPVYLSAQVPSIASTLRSAGYQTALVGKWHLNGLFNDPRQPQPDAYGFDHWMATQNNASPSHRQPGNFIRNGEAVGKLDGYSCQEVADEAIRWIDDASRDKPFLMHVCFHEPHEPIASPKDLVDLYRDAAENEKQAEYFANVTNMDAAVGRIVQYLREHSLLENTLIVFTSDNGPETLRRYGGAARSYGTTGGLRAMKLHIYEGGIRVPGIIHWPAKIKAARTDSTPVSAVDLLPTLRELVGASSAGAPAVDGTSLLGWLDSGERLERQTPLYWFYYRALTPPRFAVRSGRWKLVASWDGPLMREARTGPGGRNINPDAIKIFKSARLSNFALYDMSTDQGEQNDVAQAHSETLEQLKQRAEELFSQLQTEAPDWPETGNYWADRN